jgi:hypothetical protein
MLSLGKLGTFRGRDIPNNLDGDMASLGRGDVVLTTSGHTGIVWRVDETQVWFIPVVRAYGHRHRAEVAIGASWAACGISLRDPVAECHKLHVKRIPTVSKIGETPEALLADLIASVVREARVRQAEDRMHFSPRLSLSPLFG